MTIRLIWLFATFASMLAVGLAAREMLLQWRTSITARYTFGLLVGILQLLAGLCFLAIRSIITFSPDEPLTAGVVVVTCVMLAFVLPAGAFALHLLGYLE